MFQKELEDLINRCSQENGSNTPDFILAQYLMDCLETWNKNVMRREEWYGRKADTVASEVTGDASTS